MKSPFSGRKVCAAVCNCSYPSCTQWIVCINIIYYMYRVYSIFYTLNRGRNTIWTTEDFEKLIECLPYVFYKLVLTICLMFFLQFLFVTAWRSLQIRRSSPNAVCVRNKTPAETRRTAVINRFKNTRWTRPSAVVILIKLPNGKSRLGVGS